MTEKSEPLKISKPEPVIASPEKVHEPLEVLQVVAEPKKRILPNKSRLGSVLKEVNEQISIKKSEEKKIELTAEVLPELWKSFLEHIRPKAQTSFMAEASSQQPLLEESCIVFTVVNNVALEMLQLHRSEITSYFLSKTTAQVQLEFRLQKKAENKTYKSPKERLREMAANNDAVNQLIQKFDLNLD